jgi:hypothetical protein
MKNTQQNRQAHFVIDGAVPCTTSDRSWSENVQDLHDLVESLVSGDGQKPLIKEVTFQIRANMAAASFESNGHIVQPVVVQTAGTWTSNVDVDTPIEDVCLDGAIDDVFGYQRLGNPQAVKLARRGNGEAGRKAVETVRTLPQNILQILNKETETERLQNLYFGLVGKNYGTTNLNFRVFITVKFRMISKRIISR